MSTSPLTVFLVFLRLGLTSFGGPVAHLGYFRADLVERRRWLDEAMYADLIALCQFLPGPASSQVGIAIGTIRAGLLGGLAAWLGFTLPSALIMIAFAYGIALLGDVAGSGWLHGLKVVVVAVVAQAVWQMGQRLCPDRLRASIAVIAAVILVIWSDALVQLLVIGVGGLIGWRLLQFQTNSNSVIKSPIMPR
ncbi:MAG: chromate transporter, partial [Chloroflexi bacterium]